MTQSTTAAVWLGPGKSFELRTFDLPGLLPGEMLVKVESACICGSDLHTVAGHRNSPAPSVLGHETSGVIAAMGPGATRLSTAGDPLQLGDRVIWSVTDSCGECPRCQRDYPQKCLKLAKYGHESTSDWALSGGFAQHVQLRAGTPVAKVPAALSPAVAATASCAGATVMAAIESASSGPTGRNQLSGRKALVVGAGMLGLYACAALCALGARVTVWEPAESRRRVALGFGATEAVSGPRGAESFDLALELSGYRPVIPAALAALDVGGTLVLAGTVSPGPTTPLDPEDLVRRLLRIHSVHNYLPRHLQQAVNFLAGTDKDFASLVSEPVPLADIASAFEQALGGEHLRVALNPG